MKATLAALLFAASAALPGGAQAVGVPIYPHGYPDSYTDANGLRLELAVPATQFGLDAGGQPIAAGNSTRPGLIVFTPVDPAVPDSVKLGVGDESFFWMADAIMPMPGPAGSLAILVMGMEGAFGGVGAVKDGQQIAFGRIRIRVDTPVAGDYTITYPYGQRTFTNVPAGVNGINVTFDVGAINQLTPALGFSGALASEPVQAFLTWPNYQNEPSLKVVQLDGLGVPVVPEVVLEQYVGDPAVPHIVTGSPNGNNFFRVQGPSGTFETDLFTVMGKVYTNSPVAPRVPYVFPGAPLPNLFAVGPVNRPTTVDALPFIASPQFPQQVTGSNISPYPVGYPLWFQDTTLTPDPVDPNLPPVRSAGPLQLTYSPPADPMSISAPINTNDPASVALRVGDESFFWTADAFINAATTDLAPGTLPAGLDGILVMSLEGAFGSAGVPLDKQQIGFSRIRIRVDAPTPGRYTITYPYGEDVFDVPTVGKGKEINLTRDVMIADAANPDQSFQGALYGDIGPKFLTWDDFIPGAFNPDPLLRDTLWRSANPADPLAPMIHYVGDPTVPHAVKESPNGTNYFRIRGPGGIDVQTALFVVSGKIYDPATFNITANPAAPIANPDAATLNLRLAPSAVIGVTGNDVIPPAAAPVTIAVSTAPLAGTALVAGANVTYTPNAALAATGGTDTFSYNLTSTVTPTLVSNNAVVTVTVIPVEAIAVSLARFDTRKLLLELKGTSNFPGSVLTIFRGTSATGAPIGTIQVPASGNWSFRGTVRTNLTSVTLRSNTAFPTTVTQSLQVR